MMETSKRKVKGNVSDKARLCLSARRRKRGRKKAKTQDPETTKEQVEGESDSGISQDHEANVQREASQQPSSSPSSAENVDDDGVPRASTVKKSPSLIESSNCSRSSSSCASFLREMQLTEEDLFRVEEERNTPSAQTGRLSSLGSNEMTEETDDVKMKRKHSTEDNQSEEPEKKRNRNYSEGHEESTTQSKNSVNHDYFKSPQDGNDKTASSDTRKATNTSISPDGCDVNITEDISPRTSMSSLLSQSSSSLRKANLTEGDLFVDSENERKEENHGKTRESVLESDDDVIRSEFGTENHEAHNGDDLQNRGNINGGLPGDSDCAEDNGNNIFRESLNENGCGNEGINGIQPKKNKKRSDLRNEQSRDIVKMRYVFGKLQESFRLGLHRPFDCGIEDTDIVHETHCGLKTKWELHCNMCGLNSEVWSEPDDYSYLDINRCAVLGIHALGLGFAASEEYHANIGVYGMHQKMYDCLSVEIDECFRMLSDEVIRQNGAEERRIAEEIGSIVDGIPTCPVIVDGSWPVRTYNKGARSDCGMAVIIGARTKKVLYIDYKSRYCSIDMNAKNKNIDPPPHKCYMNYTTGESILRVEAYVISQGFSKSMEQHGLMFSHMIGDGDSKSHKAVVDMDPYKDHLTVEKVECRLHIQRCRVRDIRNLTSKFKTGRSEQAKLLKKSIDDNITRICKDVTSAANHWREQEIREEQKEENLKKDIMNIVHHIYGDHANCADYFCERTGKPGEKNFMHLLDQYKVYAPLQQIMTAWSVHAKDLLLGQTINLAECFNSLLARYIYHKGVNVQQRGVYSARIAMAAVQFSNQSLASSLHD